MSVGVDIRVYSGLVAGRGGDVWEMGIMGVTVDMMIAMIIEGLLPCYEKDNWNQEAEYR